MPLIGAYVADQYFGRLRTIQYAIRFALLGHCILIVSALPFMIARPNLALGVFTCGLIVMGMYFPYLLIFHSNTT
jgi:POT family proton-dependent oligopeptide transporter